MMKRIAAALFVALLAVPVAGCGKDVATFTSVTTAAANATVDPKAIMTAAGIFDGVKASAKNYLSLPICSATSGKVCRDPRATEPIANAMAAGTTARKAAVQFVKTHPGQLGPSGLYDALITTTSTLRDILTTYGGAS